MQVWKSINYVGVKIFLEFCYECNISDCSYLFIFPLNVFSFQSRFSALTGRSSARSLDRLFVSSFFSRSSIVNSFVRLFVRSFVRRSSVVHQSWIRSFVSSFLRLFVVRQSWVRSSVCLYVRSLVRSIARLSSESVGLSFCYPVSQPARQLVIRSVSKSVCQFFSQLLIFFFNSFDLLDIDVRLVLELNSDLVSFFSRLRIMLTSQLLWIQ